MVLSFLGLGLDTTALGHGCLHPSHDRGFAGSGLQSQRILNPMLIAQNLSKHYPSAQGWIKSLDEMDLEVKAGEFLAIRGHSGSGKTTLLLTLGAMLRPSSGRVVFEGQDMYQCSSQQRAAWRAEQIGFVFQMFHLMPYLSVLDNLCLHGRAKAGSTQRADTLLDTLNLNCLLYTSPSPRDLSTSRMPSSA